MADERKRPDADEKSVDEAEGGTVKPDRGGEAELTEKEERRQGGRNKRTPGPIYDV